MSKKNLVICDSELQYANSLACNISERNELNVKVYTCTTWDKLTQLFKAKKIDILIVDEGYSKEQREQVAAEQIFVLTRNACKDLADDEKAIYKYQCVDQILAEIFEIYYENTSEDVYRVIKKAKQRRIAIYSPIHRAGKTRFARALGKELAKNRKTLYLNLEEYAGLQGGNEKVDGSNLGDLLYYAKQENSNFGLRLGAMVEQDEDMDYVLPISICTDLKEITFSEWELLFRHLEEKTGYEIIVLDMGESVQGLLDILALCDKIYMPILDDEISKAKLRQYEENLEKLNLQKIVLKTHQLLVPENVGVYVKMLGKEEV